MNEKRIYSITVDGKAIYFSNLKKICTKYKLKYHKVYYYFRTNQTEFNDGNHIIRSHKLH